MCGRKILDETNMRIHNGNAFHYFPCYLKKIKLKMKDKEVKENVK